MTTKTEVKHTPTPWHIAQPNGMLPKAAADRIIQHKGAKIAETGGNIHMSDDENKANAEFIVRAVNAHDELVYTLRSCLSIAGVWKTNQVTGETWGDMINAALAKAEGK